MIGTGSTDEAARAPAAPASRAAPGESAAAPLRLRLARGSVWAVVGTTTSRGGYAVAMICVARLIGREDFGALGLVQSSVVSLQVFAGLGLGATATRWVAALRRTDPERAGRILVLTLLASAAAAAAVALGLALGAGALARGFLGEERLAAPLRASALLVFFGTLQGVQTSVLSGLESFRASARVQALAALLTLPMVVAGAYLGGLGGAIAGLTLGAVVSAFVLHVAIVRETRAEGVPLRLRGSAGEARVLWEFGIPALLAGLLVAPSNWLAAAWLVARPGGLGELGIFSAANHWRLAALHLPAVLGQVFVPVLSERLGAGDARAARRILLTGVAASVGLIAAIGLPLTLLAPWLMRGYGPGFERGAEVLAVLMAAALLAAIASPAGNLLIAANRMWTAFAMNLGWAVVTLAATYSLLGLGALGLALGQLIGYAANALWALGWAVRAGAPGSERLSVQRTEGAGS